MGFTLVELMVAMVLGLIVIAGVTSVFLAGQQSFRTNNALADVQDSSRVAFELMARDIRQAGLTGCNSTNGRVTNVLSNAATSWWANWENVVHGYDDVANDPGVTGMSDPNGVAGSSSLQLIGAGLAPTATSGNYDGSSASFQLHVPAPSLAAGDVIVICTPGHAAILQISGYSQASGTINFASGSGNPGNSATYLGYPATADCATRGPAEIYCFPPNSLVSRLEAVDWYIGTNPDGGSSLYRLGLQNVGGVPTPTAQEMVRNVTAMKVDYLAPRIAGIGSQFQTAQTITANSAWQAVSAVRVTLTMESSFQRASVDSSKPIAREYSFTTTLRNRVN